MCIRDRSQSVEPEHPMALDFLRMDIKNVNDFFSRKKINVYPERLLFKYITEDASVLGIEDNSDEQLGQYLETLPLKTEDDDEVEDEIFRSLHLVRSLNHLDERDFQKFSEGKVDTLTDLVGTHENIDGTLAVSDEEDHDDVDVEDDDDEEEEDEEEDEDDEDESSEEETGSEDDLEAEDEDAEGKKKKKKWVEKETILKGKRCV